MNKTATFWKYQGNHPHGKDCPRTDSHGFGLQLIAAMAYWAENDYSEPLTYEDTKKIKLTYGKADSFGCEIKVSAPLEVWEKGRKALLAISL